MCGIGSSCLLAGPEMQFLNEWGRQSPLVLHFHWFPLTVLRPLHCGSCLCKLTPFNLSYLWFPLLVKMWVWFSKLMRGLGRLKFTFDYSASKCHMQIFLSSDLTIHTLNYFFSPLFTSQPQRIAGFLLVYGQCACTYTHTHTLPRMSFCLSTVKNVSSSTCATLQPSVPTLYILIVCITLLW